MSSEQQDALQAILIRVHKAHKLIDQGQQELAKAFHDLNMLADKNTTK